MYSKTFRIGNEEVVYFNEEKSKRDCNHLTKEKFKNQFNVDLNCFQSLEKNDVVFNKVNNERVKKINKYYNNLFIVRYNANNEPIKEGILIHFDFKNSIITFSDGNKTRSYKVNNDIKKLYTYKFYKKSIKAIGGIEGLYKFYFEFLNPENQFILTVFSELEKILNE